MWVELGLGGPGWSEELGGSAGRQLVEPSASLRLAKGLGAHRRGQCSWEKPPPGLHLGTTPLPGAFHNSTGDAGVLERGQGPRLSQVQTGPMGPLWNCWESAGGTTSRWPRECTQRRAEAKTSRSEGASVPFTEKSPLFPVRAGDPGAQGGPSSGTGQKGP